MNETSTEALPGHSTVPFRFGGMSTELAHSRTIIAFKTHARARFLDRWSNRL
jgi:hypothetical protein